MCNRQTTDLARPLARTHAQRWILLLFALAVLVPSCYGFGTKFLEFVALWRGDVDGAFAITPMLNYLLASLGFVCLLGWATLGGMFRDIERPKYDLLETEARLDRAGVRSPPALESVSPWRRTTAFLPGHERMPQD